VGQWVQVSDQMSFYPPTCHVKNGRVMNAKGEGGFEAEAFIRSLGIIALPCSYEKRLGIDHFVFLITIRAFQSVPQLFRGLEGFFFYLKKRPCFILHQPFFQAWGFPLF